MAPRAPRSPCSKPRRRPAATCAPRWTARYRVEWGPNGFLNSEPATLELAAAAGLEDQLLRSSDNARRRFLFVRGALREIPTSPGAFVRSDLFSVRAKLRCLGEVLVSGRDDLGLAAEDVGTDETVWNFAARRLGREFADTMMDPMVRGITGGECRRVSLAAAFPRMVELEHDHGGLFRAMLALRRRQKAGDGNQGGGTGGPRGVLHQLPRRHAGPAPRPGGGAHPARACQPRRRGHRPRRRWLVARGVRPAPRPVRRRGRRRAGPSRRRVSSVGTGSRAAGEHPLQPHGGGGRRPGTRPGHPPPRRLRHAHPQHRRPSVAREYSGPAASGRSGRRPGRCCCAA